MIEAGDTTPGLQDTLDVIAQGLAHALTKTAAKQERYGEQDDSEDGLQHHERMAPTLTRTTAERATHDVDGLIATEHRCRDETGQDARTADCKQKDDDCNNTSILQQIQGTVCKFDGLVLQGESNQICDGESDCREEYAFANEFREHLQTRQTQQTARGHLLRAVGGERDAQIDVVEEGKHQDEQCHNHIEASHVATSMIDVILHQRAALGIVVEGGERCERNLFHCLHLINPEEGLQIVAHLIGLALQVAAFACHQEEHATGGVVHAFDISRRMDVAQILYIDHTFIARRNDGTVEVLHHTADGECHTFFWIFGIGISKLKFLAHRLLIGPAALSKGSAYYNLVGSFEHLMLVTR